MSNDHVAVAHARHEDGSELLSNLSTFLRRYMILSQAQADVCALWCVHTEAFEAAESTPYLHISAPTLRSGKTLLLRLLSLLVRNPWYTGRVTPAV